MQPFKNIKSVISAILATLLVLPIALYTTDLLWDSIWSVWKFGSQGQPMTLISSFGIKAYISYGLAVLAILIWRLCSSRERLYVWLMIVTFFSCVSI